MERVKDLLELSYTMECEPEEYKMIQLEKFIAREKIQN